jgi:transcriptional regulator with XRE-family HTH domain
MYERIRDLREDRDQTQLDLAHVLHCTQVCYSNYENGKRNIPTTALETLADHYGVSVDYLMGRTNVKTPYPKK